MRVRARTRIVDGITFHSRGEASRYIELRLLQVGKKIFNLEVQPNYPLIVGGVVVGEYTADFRYEEPGNPKLVVEEYKGYATALFRLRAKLFMALYPELDYRITGSKVRFRYGRLT